MREALFDILAFEPRGVFLDLFAGSGALGLEAASRGWRAICVDRSREAIEVVRGNARALDLAVDARLGDAIDTARALAGSVDVCSAAPPYPADLTSVFQALLDSGCVRQGGRYVFQHPSGAPPVLRPNPGQSVSGMRRYGSNAITIVRVDPAEAAGADEPAPGTPDAIAGDAP